MIGSCACGIGAVKESSLSFRPGSFVYSSKHGEQAIVVTPEEYGKLINKAQTAIYLPKKKKIVAVYNRYLKSMDDKIGAVSSGQKSCLTREFRKLYKPAKRYMSRDQKIAIALNKCNVKRK
jgi:hypothetical protein